MLFLDVAELSCSTSSVRLLNFSTTRALLTTSSLPSGRCQFDSSNAVCLVRPARAKHSRTRPLSYVMLHNYKGDIILN